MRDAKARRRNWEARRVTPAKMNAAFAKMRSLGILRDRGKARVRASRCSSGCLVLALPSKAGVLPFEVFQEVAYSDVVRQSDLARAYSLKPSTVRLMQLVVASVANRCDRQFMSAMLQKFRDDPPQTFVSSMSSDATKEEVALEMVNLKGEKASTRTSWNVMVSQNAFTWMTRSKDAETAATSPYTWGRIDMVRPNVALTATETPYTVHGAMYTARAVKDFADFELGAVRLANISFLHWDLDGHFSNILAAAQRRVEVIRLSGRLPLCSVRHCGNHVNQLIEVSTTESCEKTTYTFLSASASFFKMSANFLCLHHGFAIHVRGACEQRWVPRDEKAHEKMVADEVQHYFCRNYKGFNAPDDEAWTDSDSSDDGGGRGRQRQRERDKAYEQKWAGFRAFFGDSFWSESACWMPARRLQGADDLAKATLAASQLILDSMPNKASKGKWTKLGPAVDWWMKFLCLNNTGKDVVKKTYEQLKVRVINMVKEEQKSANKKDDLNDVELVQEMSWHRLEGSRFKYMDDNINPERATSITITALAIEPLRYITAWHMRRASTWRRAQRRAAGFPAPLCDLVSLARSPYIAVCQYYSGLLSAPDDAPRLRLLWGRSHASYKEWALARPEAELRLRRTIKTAASWVSYRQMRAGFCLPWIAAGVADTREPLAVRSALADSIYALKDATELQDEWFGEVLLELIESGGDLMTPDWQRRLHLWAWEVELSVCQREFQHRRNRRRIHPMQQWATFAANAFNGEGKLRIAAQAKAMKTPLRSRGERGRSSSAPAAPKQRALPLEKKALKDNGLAWMFFVTSAWLISNLSATRWSYPFLFYRFAIPPGQLQRIRRAIFSLFHRFAHSAGVSLPDLIASRIPKGPR